MRTLLILFLSASTSFALTPTQRTELKTRVDEAKAAGVRDTSKILERLVIAQQTGTTTNTVTQAREQWEKQLITGFKMVCTAAGITFANLATAGTVRTKLATYAQGLTAANREEFQVITAPLFWIAYDRYRSQDPATIDADNVSYQTLTPVYGTPIITFPITGADVEDVQRNP
jgi:hypothetical protein